MVFESLKLSVAEISSTQMGFGVLGAAIGIWIAYLVKINYSIKRSEAKLIKRHREAMSLLISHIHSFESKVGILVQHEVEYFQSLCLVGYAELKTIQEGLQQVVYRCNELNTEGLLEESLLLAEWVLNPNDTILPDSILLKKYSLNLVDWENRANRIVIKCAEVVSEVAEQNQSIGLKRNTRKRKSTLANIQALWRNSAN